MFEGAEGYWLSWDGNYEVHKIPQTQAQKQTQTLKKEYDGTEVSLQVSLGLRFEGLFLYIGGILCIVECRTR